MIKRREEKVKAGEAESYGSDFLGSLIKASHSEDEKNRITVEDVIDECKVFYIAGQETTNGLLAWALLLLAIHPEWQKKARDEVLELFGPNNHPHREGIARLKTISMILKETTRLYGPLVHLLRNVEKEVRLGGKLIIPANIHVYTPPLAVHHDPDIWGEDVHLFRPERFAATASSSSSSSTAASFFFPFGYGPRMCVGMNFATTEAKIALSMILQRYYFTLSPTYVHSPIQVLTIRPQHGIQLIFRPLSTTT